MSERFTPIHFRPRQAMSSPLGAHLPAALPDVVAGGSNAPVEALAPPLDRWQRPLHDLRISVTDRCNFRCTYCMPKGVFDRDYPYLPHAQLLRFEEIERLARQFLLLGVRKIRLTGGEPLLRRNLEELIQRLAALRTVEGKAPELTLTTNGVLLGRKARALKAAGLDRVTVSLDALDDGVFRRMNDVDIGVAGVLASIDQAAAAGLPVKVNMVVQRGVNDDEVVPMARHFRGTPHILRFIEFMDVGSTNGWALDQVVSAAQLVERLDAAFGIEPMAENYPGEVARRWRYRDGSGELGFIASVSQPFCRDCSRLRLSTDGRLYTCLFAREGFDLRGLIRGDADDRTLLATLRQVWQSRADRYSETRSQATPRPAGRIEMSYIGG